MWPDRFQNKTNGVTPRRFMRLANPRLSELISDTSATVGSTISSQLQPTRGTLRIRPSSKRRGAKSNSRTSVSWHELLWKRDGQMADPQSLFDVMVKRLHEYKRQLLKTLHIIWLYQRTQAEPDRISSREPFIFGAKAAPGYRMAKLIIKLINNVAARRSTTIRPCKDA